MKKRILSLMLCVCMIAGLTVTVGAADSGMRGENVTLIVMAQYDADGKMIAVSFPDSVNGEVVGKPEATETTTTKTFVVDERFVPQTAAETEVPEETASDGYDWDSFDWSDPYVDDVWIPSTMSQFNKLTNLQKLELESALGEEGYQSLVSWLRLKQQAIEYGGEVA